MAGKVGSLKFAANVSTLFDSPNMADRFRSAKSLGFSAIEAQFLYDYEIEELKTAKETNDLQVVMINSPIGSDVAPLCDEDPADYFGLACVPGQEVEFIKLVHRAIQYATALDCKQIHIIGGLKSRKYKDEDLYKTYINSIRVAAGICEEYKITVLIEPMSTKAKPKYYLNSFDRAVKVIKELDIENVKLLMDIYHLFNMNLDPVTVMKEFLPYTGHIQVSQSPTRNEPFGPGKINYEKVFNVIKREKYDGYIGLEYTPTDAGFEWLKDFGIVPPE